MFKNNRFVTASLTVLLLMTLSLSGCNLSENMQVKLGLKNQQFEYIKQNKVDKIIIQSIRDTGFRFIVTDSQAINDIYKLLSSGKEVSEKSSMDPDYVFEVWIGDQVRKYKYVVNADERGKGNFYNDKNAFLISKNLDDTIMQNLSFIRKPREFEYVYYQSILKVIEGKKDKLTNNKVGVDISGDTDCLKYMFTVDLQEFDKNLKKMLPNADLVKNNSDKFNTIVKVKNRGYNTTVFKTLITIDDKKSKSFESYYVTAEYNFKDWDITVSEVNKMPQDW